MSDFAERPTELAGAAPGVTGAPEVFAERYEVRALLGRGGMGAVYRVHDRELDEDVALKVLSAGLAAEPTAIDRFKREVKLARRVTHPNVARTYDVGHHGELRFLTMELVAGDAVSSLVRGRGNERLPLAETLRIAESIARGLSAAHAVGVVHRDLKPDNVMRCPGTNGRVVITDFGIARLAESLPEDLHLTVDQVIGTPAYMAPEQLTAKPIDGRTDVYALGVLLFELLTGALPFRRDTMVAMLAARLAEDPPDPRSIDPTVPEPIARLTLEALARRREDRLDAEMVLQRLERLRGGGERHDSIARPLRIRHEQRCVVVSPVDVSPGSHWPAEDLGAALADAASSLRGLRVVPPSIARDAASGRSVRVAARELGAQWIVETVLRSEKGRARARLRLLEADGNAQLWAAGAIEVEEGASFALEDLLVAALTNALRERLGETGPKDPAARDYYDRAREASERRTVPGLRIGATILEEAMAKFPGDPWLLCLAGRIYVGLYGMTGARDPRLAARAEDLTLRALSADGTLGEAYYAIGSLRSEQGDIRAAVRAFREALSRTPNLADAHTALGLFASETGNVDEALRRFDVALELDPGSLGARLARARTNAVIGDRRACAADLQGADAMATHGLLVRAVFWWSDRAGAAELADAFEAAPTGAPWEVAAPLLRAYSRGEYFEGAPQIFERLLSSSEAGSRNRCRAVEVAAEYYAVMGRTDDALAWLDRAESLPFVDVLWMDRCACLDAIRGEPRFARVRALVAARAADVWR